MGSEMCIRDSINANTSQLSGADTTEPTRGEEKGVTRYRYDPKTGKVVKQP